MSVVSNPQREQQVGPAAKDSPPQLETRIVTGAEEIVKFQGLLLKLSLRYGQHGTVDHLEYFLGFQDAAKKRPHLVLVGRGLSAGVTEETVVGAMLIHEYCAFGVGTRVFATDDRSGRRTMVAPADQRMLVARLAAAALLRAGARLAVLSFIELVPMEAPLAALPDHDTAPGGRSWRVATQRRLIRSHLPLESTFDATLAKMGQKTRFNLRYYRRRAEAQLGCTFIREAVMDRAEFLRFNRESTYAVSDEQAEWRYNSLEKVKGMGLCGIKDGEGRWLSIVGARRYYDVVEIDWQMNRDDLPAYSLSTVMRSYFLEEEIARGARMLFIEGGTPHAMRHSFAMHVVRDLAVARNGWFAPLVRRATPVLRPILNRTLPNSHFILQMLSEEKLQWHPWS